ncbi:DNA mismatch repair protein [Podila humilis]|nr:DNA mismatch repair protein [Podila humilis]
MAASSIRLLAPSVAEELRASLVINSLEQCTTELIQNSIDAAAGTIEVKIDVASHSVQVSDDGIGISAVDMTRIGTRYATSKCESIEDLAKITTYGFRGEAVTAISEMSLVDIVSKPSGQEFAHSTIFKFPVRQRNCSDATAAKIDTEVDRIKRAVETLALINPNVAFTMIDIAKNVKVFVCKRATDFHQRIGTVLGQALSLGLTFVQSPNLDNVYRFSGYISTQGHYNRSHQYFFLNNRPILTESIHKMITHIFQQSSFSKDSRDSDADLRRSRERHPVFVLMLKCPASEYDICADISKVTVDFNDNEKVTRIVRDTIISFLERHQFLSRAMALSLRKQTSTRKRPRRTTSNLIDLSTSFARMARVKYSRPSRTKQHQTSTATAQEKDLDQGNERIYSDLWTDPQTWEDELEFELDHDWIAAALDDDFEDDIEFERQMPQQSVSPAADNQRFEPKPRASLPHASTASVRSLQPRTSSIWAQDALRKWSNPVFETAPVPIQGIHLNLNIRGSSSGDKNDGCSGGNPNISRFFRSGEGQPGFIDSRNIQLSKDSLKQARVVSQLDNKFILCVIQASSKILESKKIMEALVVVDQHAADERVRVERLMQEMCVCSLPRGTEGGTERHQLDSMVMVPPLNVTLTSREWRVAVTHSRWLSRWGFVLHEKRSHQDVNADGDSDDGIDSSNVTTVSHHFQEQRQDIPELNRTPRPNRLSRRGPCMESDHIHGHLLALPRVVADRCVVDTALTHDLIKDSIRGSGAREDARVASWTL